MTPCAETMTPEARQLSDAIRRSRSLASMNMTTVAEGSTSTHSFSKAFDSIISRRKGWFDDSDDFGAPSQNPFARSGERVHYDCFGNALFEVNPDYSLTRERSVPVLALQPTAVPEEDPEEEKTARRARRRRTSAKIEQGSRPMRRRGSIGSAASSLSPDVALPRTPRTLRRVKSIDAKAQAPEPTTKDVQLSRSLDSNMKRSGSSQVVNKAGLQEQEVSLALLKQSKMKKSGSLAAFGQDLSSSRQLGKQGSGKTRRGSKGNNESPSSKQIAAIPPPPHKTSENRLRRSRSSAKDLNTQSPSNSLNSRPRRRQSISQQKQKSASDAGRELMLLMSASREQMDCSVPETPKSRRRTTSRRASLRRIPSSLIKNDGKDHPEPQMECMKKQRQARRTSIDSSAGFHTRNY